MNRKKLTIFILIVVVIAGGIIGIVVNSGRSNRKVVSGYSFEISEKDVIKKKYDGKYLDSFVTVARVQDNFTIYLEEVSSDRNVYIIDPSDGSTIPMEYIDDKFSTKTKLDTDINYGIIIDYSLVGAIRVVEDINKINEDKLFEEILIGIGCGIEKNKK